MEVAAWNAYRRASMPAPPARAAGSSAGRSVASFQADYLAWLGNYAADNYNSASYVDGAPLNIKATAFADAAHAAFNPRSIAGLENWGVDTTEDGDAFCSSITLEGKRVRFCLSEAAGLPIVSLGANWPGFPADLAMNGSATLVWSAQRATRCDFAPAIGTTAISGTASTGPLSATTTYEMVCTGLGGSSRASVLVRVSTAPPDPPVWQCDPAQRNYGHGDGPYVADGMYRGCAGSGSQMNIDMSTWGTCPPGMAPYGLDDSRWTIGSCAPLPMPDILVGNPVQRAGGPCQANEVIVGGYGDGPYNVCQAINTTRYRLGEQQHTSTYYNSGTYRGPFDETGLPVAIVYSFQRMYYSAWPGLGPYETTWWDRDGCVNLPYGSLSTYKNGKYCGDIRSKVLQWAGAPGDPPLGTPVKMFPDCSGLVGGGTRVAALGSNPGCIAPTSGARPTVTMEVTRDVNPNVWQSSVTISRGQRARIRWSSSNVTGCFVDGPGLDGWSNGNNNWQTPVLTASTSYSVFCKWQTPGTGMNNQSRNMTAGQEIRSVTIYVQ